MSAGAAKPGGRPKPRARRRRSKSVAPAPVSSVRHNARARGRGSKWVRWVAIGLAVLLVAAGALMLVATVDNPGSGKRVTFTVAPGANVEQVSDALAQSGLVRSPALFELYLRILTPGLTFSAGEHILRDDLSPRELAQRLARVRGRESRRVTIPEGFHHVQIGERLEAAEICTLSSFRGAVFERSLLDKLGVSGDSAEGYLFPATYELYVDSSAEQVVSQLVAETRKRLDKLRTRHADAFVKLERQHNFGERELLTFASVIEKEAAVKEERATIASVFFNRLTDPTFRPERMLQSDPTAAYGCLVGGAGIPSCATFRGTVTAAMLRDSSNPYNTYRKPGLPPGPIANPGEGAILAVLEPERTNYLYFYAKGGGRHAFSHTFQEHRSAIDSSKNKAR